ncbi:MAG: S49 family peptidase [Myxococcales bacterium]
MIRQPLTTLITLLPCLAIAGCGAPPQQPKGPRAIEIRLPGPLTESPEASLFAATATTHHRLLERLHDIAQDDELRGLLLHVPEMGDAFARAADLRNALEAVREAGKPVHCYFESTDNLGYALMAAGCERISATPSGLLNLVGLAAEALYVKELLDRVGVRAELMQVGRFKGAADTFTRTEMPPEVRQTLDAMLDDLHGSLLSAIAEGRDLSNAQVQSLVDDGPYTTPLARQAGLIDDVGFDDEAREHLREAADVKHVEHEALGGEKKEVGLSDLLKALSGGEKDAKPSGRRLVVANLEGTIMRGDERSLQSAHAVPFVEALRGMADDDDVRALVLRINSPGGSATASDLMWHAVRRVAARKPVIVSVGDMAASGGYWVASAGTRILADESSLIGSIGVVGGKIVIEDLGQRVGLRSTRLSRGERAGWMSSLHGFDAGEREAFRRSLEYTYRLFLRRISQGRGMDRAAIEPLAEGRLMTARRALEGGLVDRLGGLREAIALAREEAELPDDVEVQVWPPQHTFLQQIARLASGADARSLALQQLRGAAAADPRGLVEALVAGRDTHIAALPYQLSIH